MSRKSGHIEGETLQAYVEGAVAADDRDAVEAHLGTCARCADELAMWRTLFRDLDDLPALSPSPQLRARILDRVRASAAVPARPLPARLPFRQRLLTALPFRAGAAAMHPSAAALQDLVDPALPGRPNPRLEAHLAGCPTCQEEASAWRRLLSTLDELPSFVPSEGFAARVMNTLRSRGMSPAPAAEPSLGDRLASVMRWLIPATRKGRAVAAGVVVAPAVGVLGLIGFVAAHPLLTLSDLIAFAGWRGSAIARDAFSRLVRELSGSGVVLQGYEAVQALVASPTMVAAAIAVGWIMTLSAGWVVYRNVVAFPLHSRRHVRAS